MLISVDRSNSSSEFFHFIDTLFRLKNVENVDEFNFLPGEKPLKMCVFVVVYSMWVIFTNKQKKNLKLFEFN